jgi:RNA polymerase sigma-70 factor, ECF subfamily
VTSDDELARRVSKGNRAAFAELHGRYVAVVWRYAWGQLRPHEAAATDVVSETFLTALAGGYDPARGSAVQWLMGIARHKIADARRSLRMIQAEKEPSAPQQTDPLAAEETRLAVAKLMAELGDEERLVLEWKYLDGVSVRDIAARLGRTERGAEALLFRARQAFREKSSHLSDLRESAR